MAVAVVVASLAMVLLTWLDRRRGNTRARWVDRLDIDDTGFKYTAFEPHSEGARWSDVHRVLFYHGEPDFPDPLAGMAAVAEWHFVYLPDYRSAHVPHSARDTPRLAAACAKQLPGFDVALLREVSTLEREGHWLLWERPGVAGRSAD
jgi:hypothetical protein